jgi:DNA gyrase/topoisomerase IV subunit A
LAGDAVLFGFMKEELVLMREKYGSPRATNIEEYPGEFRIEDVKRLSASTVRKSHLKGVSVLNRTKMAEALRRGDRVC